MRKKLLIIILILLSIIKIINVNAVVEPTEKFYINDFANVLSEETEEYILSTSVALEKATSAQVVVVTIPSLNGQTIEQYSVELFRKYGIGNSEKNNGLLLLLALEEREFRVEVGYGLEELLPDGLTGRYQDNYIIPYLKEDKWDEGIRNGYTAFIKKICEHYDVTNLKIEEIKTNNIKSSINEDDENDWLLRAGLLGLFFGLIFNFIINATPKETDAVKTKNLYALITAVGNIVAAFYLMTKAGISAILIMVFVEIYIISNSSSSGYGFGHRGGSSHRGGRAGGFRGGGGRSGGGGSTRHF